MTEGWISIHRSIVDNKEWFSEPFTRAQAWIDILLIANHKENSFYVRGNLVTVLRGQFAYGELELSKRWQWSRSKVRRYLSGLESRQQVIQQKNRVLSLYTIINYDKYQVNDTTERTQIVQQKDNRKTTERQQKNINNNVNNVNNVNKNTRDTLDDPLFVAELSTLFPMHDVPTEIQTMQDYIASSGKRYKDYKAFARNWLRRAKPSRQEVIQI